MALSNPGNFIINNIEFHPKALKVGFESLSSADSGRTDDGAMHITWVYNRIRKLEIEMPPCTAADIAQLFPLVQGKIYNMTYFDPLTNSEQTKEFYTSNSAADCYSGVIMNGLYQGAAFNAIETEGELDA